MIENGADESAVKSSLQSLQQAHLSDIFLISSKDASSGARFISLEGRTLNAAMDEALSLVRNEQIMILDARLALDSAMLKSLMQSSQPTASIGIFSFTRNGQFIEISEPSTEALFPLLSSSKELPTHAAIVSRRFAMEFKCGVDTSAAELIASMIIKAIVEHEDISRYEDEIEIRSRAPSALSNQQRANLVHFLVDNNNIEDIFPSHDWVNHQEESAAASYHTLAAMFLSLGDSQSALQALQLGDQFEDSPRALALRALIARQKGEVLGAVANLVTSLQQYEARKKNRGHYLSFIPSNLEVINSSLSAGLSALNQRDNETALGCFAEAVFNFDSFFKEFGLDRIQAIKQ